MVPNRLYVLFMGLVGVGLWSLASCATVDAKEVPQNLTVAQLMKEAQVANSQDDFDTARTYFNLIKSRFPNNAATVAEADYNLANILYKTGRFAEARVAFAAVLDLYTKPGKEALPPFIPSLVLKLVKQMDEAEAKKAPPTPLPAPVQVPNPLAGPSPTPEPTR